MARAPLELRPVGAAGVRLVVEDGRLTGYGRRGERVELTSARALWIFRRDRLAVLDRHGGGLVWMEAEFCPYQTRAFADGHGLALWVGALSDTEPRYRLARTRRLRGPRRGLSKAGWPVRRWAAAHGLVTATART